MIFQSPPPPVVQPAPQRAAAAQGQLLPLVAIPAGDEPEAAPPQPDRRVIRPPAWVRSPTLTELRAAYPPAAAADGVSGQGKVFCRIEPDATLSRCYVIQAKGGYGFNEAALSLTPLLRIRQTTIDGRPVTNGRVAITINFILPAAGLPAGVLWTAAPSAADVRNALPQTNGIPLATGGRGVVRCTVIGGLLGECAAAGDRTDPLNRAADKLAPKFAVAPALANGRATEGLILDVPVAFDAPGAKPPAPALENPVRFVRGPTNAQKDAVFPSAARERGVRRLTVTESCTTASDGSLTQCRTDKEDPVGVGGAQAAARLVNAFQLSTWTSEGRPTAGAPVTVEITWDETPTASVEPAAAPASSAKPPPKGPTSRR